MNRNKATMAIACDNYSDALRLKKVFEKMDLNWYYGRNMTIPIKNLSPAHWSKYWKHKSEETCYLIEKKEVMSINIKLFHNTDFLCRLFKVDDFIKEFSME